MKLQKFIKQSEIDAPPAVVFAFHERPTALIDLTPPWERVEVIQSSQSIQVGATTVLKTYLGPLPQYWEAEHVEYDANRLFADVQRRGPFAHWYHRHRFEPTSRGTTMMIDEIEYALPGGWLGNLVAGRWVRARLERLFAYRHKILAEKIAEERRTEGEKD